MAIITLTKTRKIGKIKQLTPMQFEIPDQIVCPEDGEAMNFEPWNDNYVCPVCNNKIAAVDFVRAEIQKENQNELSK